MEDSPYFSGWYYLIKVPAPSSFPSQAQQGHTVDIPRPPPECSACCHVLIMTECRDSSPEKPEETGRLKVPWIPSGSWTERGH